MLAVLIMALLVAHLPLVTPAWPLLLALFAYCVYTIVRLCMPPRLEDRYYTARVQFWRAQGGILAITLLLAALKFGGSSRNGTPR